MGYVEIAALEEALCNQYLIIRKLNNDLEEERNASATAATEALSMILRLQREKAAEKMEACQYKRMAEEKMYHLEESLEILEEVTQQKEIEITSLKFQLQACETKLLSIGVNYLDVGDMRIFENASLSEIACLDKACFHGFVRRNISLPSLHHDHLCHGKDIVDEGSSLAGQTIGRKIGNYTNQLKENSEKRKLPDLCEDSAKRGEKLSTKLERLTQAKHDVGCESSSESNEIQSSSASNDLDNLEEESTSCSWYSAMSSNMSCDSTIVDTQTEFDGEIISCLPSQAKKSENIPCDVHISSCLESESKGSTVHTLSVNDNKDCCSGELYRRVLNKSILGTKTTTEFCDFMPSECTEYLFKDDNLFNKSFMYTDNGSKMSKPREELSEHNGNKLSTPKKEANCEDYHWTLVDHNFGITASQADIEQLKRRLQRLEDARSMKQKNSETGKEQLTMLHGIYEQLTTIETYLKIPTPKKFRSQEESPLVSIMEAVLSFSL